ncbi:MAG: sortase [bacterium]
MTTRHAYMQMRRRRGPRWPAALLLAASLVMVVTATALATSEGQVVKTASSVPSSTKQTLGAMISPTSSATAIATSLSTTTTIYIHAIPHPVRIVIPAIEVDATTIDVGLLDGGDMEVPPFGKAGWYALGPAPGAGGPAVLVAHVDSTKGPDVFYRLKDLKPGDEILVYGEDGDLATFVMDTKEQQLKSELPVERIWSDTWEPVIRLITCGGEFDRDSRHYLSNVIVYGHLTK